MTYARDASGTWHRIRDDVCAPNGDHAVLGACGHRFTATELRDEYAEHDTCCGCRHVPISSAMGSPRRFGGKNDE